MANVTESVHVEWLVVGPEKCLLQELIGHADDLVNFVVFMFILEQIRFRWWLLLF